MKSFHCPLSPIAFKLPAHPKLKDRRSEQGRLLSAAGEKDPGSPCVTCGTSISFFGDWKNWKGFLPFGKMLTSSKAVREDSSLQIMLILLTADMCIKMASQTGRFHPYGRKDILQSSCLDVRETLKQCVESSVSKYPASDALYSSS